MAKSKGAKKAAPPKRKSVRKTAAKKSTVRKAGTHKTASRKTPAKKTPRKWSRKVIETSDAMDLEQGVFKGNDPKKIARSVQRSASRSKRRKTTPYQSAMSMLNFYVNRGGKNLSAAKRKVLEKAKEELRKMNEKED